MRDTSFIVCSVCDEIVSTYTQKYQIKMQSLTINNRNFEKPSKDPSYRIKVKILEKTNFG